jgi:hypothetical protein
MRPRDDWLTRIKAVEREYRATSQAVAWFLNDAGGDPNVLADDLRHRDIKNASSNLEGTYLIRLFAEFETGVRHYWSANWDTEPPTRSLLDGLAARQNIPTTTTTRCHLVRDYRNFLVHERESDMAALNLGEARAALCTFFSFLPEQW